MTHVVTESCILCKYTDEDPNFLVLEKTFRCGQSRHLEFRRIDTALCRQKSFKPQTGIR